MTISTDFIPAGDRTSNLDELHVSYEPIVR
jgi:hypothetical protein